MRRLGAAFILLIALFSLFYFQQSQPRQTGPLTHHAYVWQRRWDSSMQKALQDAPKEISSLNILAAELTWTRKGENHHLIHVPWKNDWISAKRKVFLSLRIGEYSGSFSRQSKASQIVLSSVDAILSRAENGKRGIAGLQLDFDCPSSKLHGYRKWILMIQDHYPGLSLSITSLPTWLKERAFSRLINSLDHFVLQVHSFQRPRNSKQDLTTCPSKKALEWVEEAASIEKSFFVALPTYSYLVHFNEKGRFQSLSADANLKRRPSNGSSRLVRSNSEELAALVRVWERSRPRNLKGLIWYRLPSPQDQMNWPIETFRSVIKGQPPEKKIELCLETSSDGLWELYLVNSGDRELRKGPRIQLSWSDGAPIAYDCFASYSWSQEKSRNSELSFGKDSGQSFVLKPGERCLVAWLRLAGENYVEATIHSGF
ncbi:MAG: DUF3142 domain-containing protein [Planctomycetota bacterium]|nr:DUF3142 domain-containing protein [Planctomycetota bacterium]